MKRIPLLTVLCLGVCAMVLHVGSVLASAPDTATAAPAKASKAWKVGSNGPPAPWLLPPCPNRHNCATAPFSSGFVEAFNRKVAVLMTREGQLFAATRGGRVVGPLRGPQRIVDLDVLASGRIVVLDDTDRLWSAKDAQSALNPKSWKRVPRVGEVMTFSAAGKTLAFIDHRRKAFVATWKGRSAAPSKAKPIALTQASPAFAVAVRTDGLIALQVGPKVGKGNLTTLLRRPGSRTWERSTFQPRGINASPAAVAIASSDGAVLAADGETWLSIRSLKASPDSTSSARKRWSQVFKGNGGPTGASAKAAFKFFEGVSPPKSRGFPMVRGAGPRKVALGIPGAVAVGGLPGSRGTPPYLTKSLVAFTGDGRCAAKDAQEGRCKPESRLLRAPQIAWKDFKTGGVTLSSVPKGCRPISLFKAAGLGVLTCGRKGQQKKVFTASHDDPKSWHLEGTMKGPRWWEPAMAADGTLAFQQHCPSRRWSGGVSGLGSSSGSGTLQPRKGGGFKVVPDARPKPPGKAPKATKLPKKRGPACGAWVRRPVAAGTKNAWRYITVKDAIAYRPAKGGHLLALRTSTDRNHALELVHHDGAGNVVSQLVVGAHRVTKLHVEDDRVVVTKRWSARFGIKSQRAVINADGTLRHVK